MVEPSSRTSEYPAKVKDPFHAPTNRVQSPCPSCKRRPPRSGSTADRPTDPGSQTRPASRSVVMAEERHGRYQPGPGDGRSDSTCSRRQCHRCRHRYRCRARPHGADVVRSRRRSVRHRLGQQDEEALRPQRQRPVAVQGDPRRLPQAGPQGDSRVRPAVVVGARPARMDEPASEVRQVAARRHPRPDDRVRRGRLPRHRSDRRSVGQGQIEAVEDARRGPDVSAGRPSAPGRRRLQEPEPGSRLPGDRQGGSRRLLQGLDRRQDRRLLRQGRRPVRAEGLRRPHRDLGRSRQRDLPRLPGVGTAAAGPGDRGPADAEPPVGVRPQEDGPAVRRLLASVHRGEEARLRRPGPLLRRPRFRQVAEHLAGADLDAPQADGRRKPIDLGKARTDQPAGDPEAGGSRHHLSVRCGQGPQPRLVHPEHATTPSASCSTSPATSASRCRTAAPCSPSTRSTSIVWSRTSARSTRSSRRW